MTLRVCYTERIDYPRYLIMPKPYQNNKTITLKDVANVAGLSPITISRALNNPELVKAATLDKVKKAIDATGYIPNLLAGSLASNRSKLIAAATPQINNTMFVDILQALSGQLSDRGYHMLICMTGYSLETEEAFISTILSRRPDGIVLTGIEHTQALRKKLLSANIPIMETWDYTPTPLDMLVGFSHEKIGQHIAQYLLNQGYKKFALVWADDKRAQLRKKAILDTLQNADIDIVNIPTYDTVTPASFSEGRNGLANLLEKHHKFEVVICSSDILAQGVISEATARGITIPKQLAIMGFGDLSFAQYNTPAISTVSIDRLNLGKTAANMLVDTLEGKEIPQKIIDIGFRLEERETT